MIIGIVVAIAGVILLPLPGPGCLVIAAGLAVLARESERMARILDGADKKLHDLVHYLKRRWWRCGRERHVVLAFSAFAILIVAAGVCFLIIRG